MKIKEIEVTEHDGKFYACAYSGTHEVVVIEEGSTALESLGNLLLHYHGNFGVDNIKNVK